MGKYNPDITTLSQTFDPAGYGYYLLARALGRALGVPKRQTNTEAYKREYERLRRAARARGFDVEAWLKARRTANLQPDPPAPDTDRPKPRPPQTFEY